MSAKKNPSDVNDEVAAAERERLRDKDATELAKIWAAIDNVLRAVSHQTTRIERLTERFDALVARENATVKSVDQLVAVPAAMQSEHLKDMRIALKLMGRIGQTAAAGRLITAADEPWEDD